MRGNNWYQEIAQEVLPILVARAEAGRSITYGRLAAQIDKYEYRRKLGPALGAIGRTLADEMPADVPPIQCLVVDQHGICGAGVGWFLGKMTAAEFKALPKAEKRKLVDQCHKEIFAYPNWRKMLDKLDLQPIESDLSEITDAAARPLRGGKGESDEHKALKIYIAAHPKIVGVSSKITGKTEKRLPSGDCLDVSFRGTKTWTAVEVKAINSPEADIARGIYQCVKYIAVMQAIKQIKRLPHEIHVLLVVSGQLTDRLSRLKDRLGVTVIPGVAPE
jgi:hypothetical protein